MQRVLFLLLAQGPPCFLNLKFSANNRIASDRNVDAFVTFKCTLQRYAFISIISVVFTYTYSYAYAHLCSQLRAVNWSIGVDRIENIKWAQARRDNTLCAHWNVPFTAHHTTTYPYAIGAHSRKQTEMIFYMYGQTWMWTDAKMMRIHWLKACRLTFTIKSTEKLSL